MNKTVFIENPDNLYWTMFLNRGWTVEPDYKKADTILFTGGHDVDPYFYNEARHPTTSYYHERDLACIDIFNWGVEAEKNFLGICRGSQFLTVMAGGSLYQNVEGHGRSHVVTDLRTGKSVPVSSTHHQMMDSSKVKGRELVAVAHTYRTRKERGIKDQYHYTDYDEEVNWYPHIKALAFQPHPEFFKINDPCQEYFFDLVERYLGVR